MLKRVHVNMHAIRANRQNGTNEPVITVKTYRSNDYGHRVEVLGPGEFIYSPEDPLSCGARLWFETRAPVLVDGQEVA